MDRPVDKIEEMFWTYIRGDLDEAAFEAWVYASPDLETVLGAEDFLAIASCDYRDKSGLARRARADVARDVVTRHFPRRCVCFSAPNIDKQNLGADAIPLEDHVDIVAQRNPSIRLVRCRECGTHWLMGYDTVDDNLHLHRLPREAVDGILTRDRWPSDFDHQPNLWPKTVHQLIRDYDEAIRRNPDDAASLFSRGVVYVNKGDNDAAFRDFDQAIKLRQDLAWPFVRRGDCYRIKGDADAALRDYDRAIELGNDQYALMYAHLGHAGILQDRHEFEQAIKHYDRVLELAPRFAGAFKDRGMAHAALGDFNRAIEDFDRAIELGRKLRNDRVVLDALVRRGTAVAAKGGDTTSGPT
jgi:Tetratricopeptide repeat